MYLLFALDISMMKVKLILPNNLPFLKDVMRNIVILICAL